MDSADPIRIIFSFALVVGLIGLLALALKYIAKRNPGWAMMSGAGGRLKVIESKNLDAQRRLVLIARDGQEHVLLLSPQGNIVVEKVEKVNA